MLYLIKFEKNGRRGETYVADEKTQEEIQELLDNGFEEVSEEDYQLLLGNVIARVVYEFSLILLVICRNTTDIAKNTSKKVEEKKDK